MYTSSYGMFFVGVALGGVVLPAIFSMLVMTRNQDEDQDRLEIELRQKNLLASSCNHETTLDDILLSVDLYLKEGGSIKP